MRKKAKVNEIQETHGPVVFQTEGTDTFRAFCFKGRFDCAFRLGHICKWVKPARNIETLPDTPDWCVMKESALNDARKMAQE